jgi:N-carbamoyl-L-amino-acid hydrolase
MSQAAAAVAAVRRRQDLAERLFEDLAKKTRMGRGIRRPSYSPEENYAHDLCAEVARGFGLEVTRDAAANTYMTLPGRDRTAPPVLMGSHLDSVDQGGNYDGAAGVVAGLTALAGLKDAGLSPARDLVAMGVRAEESAWFQVSYVGSRAALGSLPKGALEGAKRVDTGRTLAQHIAECGGDPERLAKGPAHLDAERLRAFLEVHIEQGPTLQDRGLPIGIGAGIPGNFRHPAIRVTGAYGHVGYAREYRRDAVLAAAELVTRLDALWRDTLAQGRNMTMTVGRFFTEAEHHALTKVSGAVELSLDMRSTEPDLVKALEARFDEVVADVAAARRVQIDPGPRTRAEVGLMDPAIRDAFRANAAELNIAHMDLPSPAGHDSAAFSAAGVPTAMIFVRNDKGSHNPDERMEMADFMDATAVMGLWLARNAT